MPRKTPSFALSGGFGGGTVATIGRPATCVFGLEVDGAGRTWARPWTCPWPRVDDYTIRSMGTVHGRIGCPRPALLYGNGGYAWADNRLSATALGVSISDSQFHSGWTVGAGAEVMFAPKWSVKAEYLYTTSTARPISQAPFQAVSSPSTQAYYHFN